MTNAALKEVYDEIYGSEEVFFTNSGIEEAKAIIDYLPIWEGKRVLEIGCGKGRLASMMAAMGADVTAVDYSNEAIRHANSRYSLPNLKFVCQDYKEMPWKFGVVVMQGVLEHLDEPMKELEWIMEHLVQSNGVGSGKMCITSSPSFYNLRGAIWMTLQLVMGLKLSLTDKHIISLEDIRKLCGEKKYRLDYKACNLEWGCGLETVRDFQKRLPDVFKRAGVDCNADALLAWVKQSFVYFAGNDNYTGANMIYKIRK